MSILALMLILCGTDKPAPVPAGPVAATWPYRPRAA
jgi:hypothetical protein